MAPKCAYFGFSTRLYYIINLYYIIYILSVKTVCGIPKQDRTIYMIVYLTCHDRLLHHPNLIKDQIFGSDGFREHKICVNMWVRAAYWWKFSPTYILHQHLSPTYIFRQRKHFSPTYRQIFTNIIHQHTYNFEWADHFSPTYYFTNIIFTNIMLFRRWMLVKVFHQHTCFSPICIFHPHPSPTLEQPRDFIVITKIIFLIPIS